jgi:hypothetical protein
MSVRKENNYKYRGSESPVAGRADNEDSWRSKTPDTPGRAEANDVWRPKAANKPTEKESPNMLDDLRRPAFTDHQKKQNGKPTKAASSNNVTETEKSWMKIVKLTKEEQDELQM